MGWGRGDKVQVGNAIRGRDGGTLEGKQALSPWQGKKRNIKFIQ